jgi:pimeloyl-ACP methyl ester carboxylesterase
LTAAPSWAEEEKAQDKQSQDAQSKESQSDQPAKKKASQEAPPDPNPSADVKSPEILEPVSEAEAPDSPWAGYDYPFPVDYLPLNIEGQEVLMAFMDVKPLNKKATGETIVLLHGKNFFGSYWKGTISALAGRGYRVIVPDQIGFGKSGKPDINYSFELLAENTKKLLESLNIDKAIIVGHSMGGMLAARFALLYPEMVSKLILENPIGLEDYSEKVPAASLEEIYQGELAQTEEKIRKYHQTYYVEWKPEFDEYVQAAARGLQSDEAPRLARVSALTAQMIYDQPVVHDFSKIQAPTFLIIGQEDRTTIGRDRVDQKTLATLGQYPELGKKASENIPDAELAELEGVGHIPHLEAPDKFHWALLEFLQGKSKGGEDTINQSLFGQGTD